MKDITVQCDRCGKIVYGQHDEDVKLTAGYYDVAEGSWAEFARWEEQVVCDDCMHSDPKYKKIFTSP